MAFKIEEKQFLDKAFISNINSLINAGYFSMLDQENNSEINIICNTSMNLTLAMLKKRNEIFGNSYKKESIVKEKIDYEDIINKYNTICVSLPKVETFTKQRKMAIDNIMGLYSYDDIVNVLKLVAESNSLSGRSNSSWIANFDWIFTYKNFVKIGENTYVNRVKPTNTNTSEKYER